MWTSLTEPNVKDYLEWTIYACGHFGHDQISRAFGFSPNVSVDVWTELNALQVVLATAIDDNIIKSNYLHLFPTKFHPVLCMKVNFFTLNMGIL